MADSHTAIGGVLELQNGDEHYTLRKAVYVICLNGTTCLLLTNVSGAHLVKEGIPQQMADWYQTCFDAGLPVSIQVSERPRTQRVRAK
ncbi:hypothetical protein ACU63Y_21230 [Klebsiella aerogenes]